MRSEKWEQRTWEEPRAEEGRAQRARAKHASSQEKYVVKRGRDYGKTKTTKTSRQEKREVVEKRSLTIDEMAERRNAKADLPRNRGKTNCLSYQPEYDNYSGWRYLCKSFDYSRMLPAQSTWPHSFIMLLQHWHPWADLNNWCVCVKVFSRICWQIRTQAL